MGIKKAVADTTAVAKVGQRVAAAVRKEVPTASAAVRYKVTKFKQNVMRPKTEPIARAFVEKVARPTLDKAEKLKKALVQKIESPDHKFIQDYKREGVKVAFKEAARQPLTLKRTVAEPKIAGDKRAQAQQLLARITDPKAPKPGPQPGERPTKTK
jgi:glutamyl-tRNA reductase